MQIALAQLAVARSEPDTNLEKISALAAEAKACRAQAVFLPEMCTTGFNWAKNRELLETSGAVLQQIIGIAKANGLSVCGSFLEKTESGGAANTFYYIDRAGAILAKYRKIHLFTLFREEAHVEPGERVVSAKTEMGRIGCAVCYDLRFPELFRRNTLAGAGIHVLPAAFPHPRLDHWRVLIRARAIENQSYLIAVNQCGFEGHGEKVGDIHYFGHSMVVDPWGKILVEADETEGLYYADVDPAQIESTRSKLTALKDRRPELY